MDFAMANAIAENLAGIGPVGGLFGQSVNLDTEPTTTLTSNPATDPNNVGGLFGSGVAAAQAADRAQAAAEALAAAVETPAPVGGLFGFGPAAGTAAANAADEAQAAAAAMAAATEADAQVGGSVFGGPDNPSGDVAGTDPGAGGYGATDSSENGGFGGESQFAQGGPVRLAGGGLVPLANGGKIAIGPGGGLDDLIPTSINGRRAAALSDGEFVIPADVVSMMGDGSSNAGARRFYDLVKQVRQTKTGTSRQAGPLPVGDILKRSLAR
jgi:hypothetical protein